MADVIPLEYEIMRHIEQPLDISIKLSGSISLTVEGKLVQEHIAGAFTGNIRALGRWLRDANRVNTYLFIVTASLQDMGESKADECGSL